MDNEVSDLPAPTGSLSNLKNRSENLAGRGRVLPVNSRSIDQKSGRICTGQAHLQPISFKSDRLLEAFASFLYRNPTWKYATYAGALLVNAAMSLIKREDIPNTRGLVQRNSMIIQEFINYRGFQLQSEVMPTVCANFSKVGAQPNPDRLLSNVSAW